jgi:hypothetical protein
MLSNIIAYALVLVTFGIVCYTGYITYRLIKDTIEEDL